MVVVFSFATRPKSHKGSDSIHDAIVATLRLKRSLARVCANRKLQKRKRSGLQAFSQYGVWLTAGGAVRS